MDCEGEGKVREAMDAMKRDERGKQLDLGSN